MTSPCETANPTSSGLASNDRIARWRDRGASLVEYALLVSLIALVCLAALRQFGVDNGGSINNSSERIVQAQDG
jgi:Flp pilus assembly pilin Flp